MIRLRPTPAVRQAGFSLVETLCVASLTALMLSSAVAWSQNAADAIQGDANQRVVLAQLTFARETAINQRRSVEVQFLMPNVVQVVRHDLPAGTTVLSLQYLSNNGTFVRFAGVPDTPDGFGGATALSFGGATQVMFTADGMFTDANGNPVNGSVFLGRASAVDTARALTIFGATARVRTYRWSGSAWSH